MIDGMAVKGWFGGVSVVKVFDSSKQVGQRFDFCELSSELNINEDENLPMEMQLKDMSVNYLDIFPGVLRKI